MFRTPYHQSTWTAKLYSKLIYALFADWHALLIMQSSIHCAIRAVYIFYIFFVFRSVFILFLSWVFYVVVVVVAYSKIWLLSSDTLYSAYTCVYVHRFVNPLYVVRFWKKKNFFFVQLVHRTRRWISDFQRFELF